MMLNDLPRFLVVDDNPANRDVLGRRLVRLGHSRIDHAEDGLRAVNAVRAASGAGEPYDVVLLDVMMPGLNGVEVLETLTAERLLAQTSVIMISASSEVETVGRCIELGAEDYLPKPFNPILLRARLGNVLEKKRLRDELHRQLIRLEREMSEARIQQLSMVPTEFPPVDPAYPVRVHGVMHPAREVGGDLYDCFELAPGVLCLAVGDVSGKGMPAALFMARARSLLRASALYLAGADNAVPLPSRLAAVLNEELCKNNPTGMFLTLFLGFLTAATGQLCFINAGHVRPLRLARDGSVTELETRPNAPLGVMPELSHTDHATDLARGEALVMFTDGLPEMADPAGAFYTLGRVTQDVAALVGAAPDVMTAALAGKAQTFAAGSPAYDDVTILVVSRD